MTRPAGLFLLAVSLAAFNPNVRTAPTTPGIALARLPSGGIQPQVAVDAEGKAHVLFFQGDPARGDLFYARLDRLGGFGKPVKVNSQAGSVLAKGTVRGGHIAVGRNGRVHVTWAGSDVTRPKGGDTSPVFYTRMNDAGARFEPERNVVQAAVELDADAVAADDSGHVYVAWHGAAPGTKGEAERRLWVARSADDGRTFAPERAASDAATGACGCCGVGAIADPTAGLFLLYRSATDSVHRDTYLLSSRDHGATYASIKLQDWNIAACPMSTFSFGRSPSGVLAAWETDGQIFWTRIDPRTGKPSPIQSAPGASKLRKHPAIAANAKGEILLVWVEASGWNKAGTLAWQLFDQTGAAVGAAGRAADLPIWGLAAVTPQPDGGFVVIY